MTDRTALARQALRAAMQLRRNLTIPRDAPVNAFDVAMMIGADVRFVDAPSLEGMLVRDPGLRILLPSTKHRPKARILFSCAHEIGHHQFGHGTKVDRYVNGAHGSGWHNDEEFLADSFAGHLLMPRPAVIDSFVRRCWNPQEATAAQTFIVAGELGVGYAALVTHMNVVMEVLNDAHRDCLAKISPKQLKADFLGAPCPAPLVIADRAWKPASVDAERGNVVILPAKTGHKCPLLACRGTHNDLSIYTATGVGESQITLERDVVLRVSREHYVGPMTN